MTHPDTIAAGWKKTSSVNPFALTAQDVLDRYPEAAKSPYRLRFHDGGLACMAGKRAWVYATPNPDGTWHAVGRLGRVGNTRREILIEGPVSEERFLDVLAAEPDGDLAPRIASAVFWVAMTTRMLADYRPLLLRYPDLELHSAGGFFPFQATGTLHGMPFYLRYKYNGAVLKVGHGDLHFKPTYMSAMEYGEHEDQGWLDRDGFIAVMSTLIDTLEHAPILWEFPGVTTYDTPAIPAGSPTTYQAWGMTPDEAWERLHEPSAWLRERGLDDATQAAEIAARKMRNETLTVDDRVFPNPEPRSPPKSRTRPAAACGMITPAWKRSSRSVAAMTTQTYGPALRRASNHSAGE